MSGIFRIKDWTSNFENNRTRELKHMAWVPVPNKHDGDGYTELVGHKDGAAHLGAWLAILQTASKCGTRGTLLRDNGHPHTAKTISRLSRIDEAIISAALDRLCSSDIGWVEVVDSDNVTTIPHKGATIPHLTDQEGKGMELNGNEENGKEIVPVGTAIKNKVPTIEEIFAYADACAEKSGGDKELYREAGHSAYQFYSKNMRVAQSPTWKDGSGKTVTNWKIKLSNVWFNEDKMKKNETWDWTNM